MVQNARLRRERHLEAAEGYLALDMPDHALAELDSIEDPCSCSARVNRLRGEALRRHAKHHEALVAYNKALAVDPDDLVVLLGMAWCYKRIGQLPMAISAMEQAYRAKPDESIILYNMACYFALAGEKAQALAWLGRALRMDSSLRKLIPGESDFDGLRNDPDFQFIAHAGSLSDAP